MSVRPRYAESILTGDKSAEVRRQRPDIRAGTPVIIYATKPVGAVIGTARVDDVHEGSPQELWDRYHDQMALSQDEYDQYLIGAATACILILSGAHRLPYPLTLDDMREAASFQPPRSYRYVNRNALHTLVNGHPGSASLLSLLRV